MSELTPREPNVSPAQAQPEQSDSIIPTFAEMMEVADEMQRVADKRAVLPERIGLCPDHQEEFFYPLSDDEGPTCPACSLEMTIYVRECRS